MLDLDDGLSSSSPFFGFIAIPSLLCGLCHKSSEVRQAAAEACQALVTACEANNTTSRDIPLLPVMEAMAQLSVRFRRVMIYEPRTFK